MSNYDAILWDNDGVLVDTEQLYFQATREVMSEAGVALDHETYREYFLNRATGAWHLIEALGYSDDAIEAMRVRRNARHSELLQRPGLAIEGAYDVVNALSNHMRMGIVTSAWRTHFEASHADSGMTPYFEFVLTREDYERSKPDPEPYLLGLTRLGLPPERCLVIEDTERGLMAAKAAGLDCWVIPAELGRGGAYTGADAVLDSIQEVPARLGLEHTVGA